MNMTVETSGKNVATTAVLSAILLGILVVSVENLLQFDKTTQNGVDPRNTPLLSLPFSFAFGNVNTDSTKIADGRLPESFLAALIDNTNDNQNNDKDKTLVPIDYAQYDGTTTKADASNVDDDEAAVEEFFGKLKVKSDEVQFVVPSMDRRRLHLAAGSGGNDGAALDDFVQQHSQRQAVATLGRDYAQSQSQRRVLQTTTRSGGGFVSPRGSYWDSQLRGSGLFDTHGQEENDLHGDAGRYTDMTTPLSTTRSGPHGYDSTVDSTTRSHHSTMNGSAKGGNGHYYMDKYYGNGRSSKSNKGSKGTKKGDSPKYQRKKSKHTKRGKGSKKRIDKRLGVDGYIDDWFDPLDEVDDQYNDEWHYNDWAWEYESEEVNEDPTTDSLLRTGGSGGDEPTLSPSPTMTASPTPQVYLSEEVLFLGKSGIQSRFDNTEEGQSSSSSSEFASKNDVNGPMFIFPTIQHMIYSGSIHLKARSVHDLSDLDPEIFAVLESVLTPYLQAIVGHTLQAYSLEVDYTPGSAEDQSSVSPGLVVTNMEVTVTLKVKSDSIVSLKRITHQQVNQWVRDFFDSESDISSLLSNLQDNNIEVSEIVFIEDTFKTHLNDDKVVAGINAGGYGGKNMSAQSSPGEDDNTGMVVGVTLAILAVGCVVFLHLTGNLPSVHDVRNFQHNVTKRLHLDSVNGSGDDEDDFGVPAKGRSRTWSATFRRHPNAGIRKAAIQKAPAYSDDYLSEGSKYTVSGANTSGSVVSSSTTSTHTPNRESNKGGSVYGSKFDDYSFSVAGDYNVGGDYDTALRSQGSPSGRSRSHGGRTSYGRGGYYSPRASSNQSEGDDHDYDEFSMPKDYDTIVDDDGESVYSKWSQSVMSFLPGGRKNRSKHNKIHPPPGSPRRVTPSDLASPRDHRHQKVLKSSRSPGSRVQGVGGGGEGTLGPNVPSVPANMDAWSVDSYDTKSPSTRGLYRDWSTTNPASMENPTSRSKSKSKHANLVMPTLNK